jgi:hypothetical protein
MKSKRLKEFSFVSVAGHFVGPLSHEVARICYSGGTTIKRECFGLIKNNFLKKVYSSPSYWLFDYVYAY